MKVTVMDQQQHQAQLEQLRGFVQKAGLEVNEQNIWLANAVFQELGAMQQDQAALQKALDHYQIDTSGIEKFYQELGQLEQSFHQRAESFEARGEDLQKRAEKKSWMTIGASIVGGVAGWIASNAAMGKLYPGPDGKPDMKPFAKGAGRVTGFLGGSVAANFITRQFTMKPLEIENDALKAEGEKLLAEYEQAAQSVMQQELAVKQQVVESLAQAMLLDRANITKQSEKHAPAPTKAPEHKPNPPKVQNSYHAGGHSPVNAPSPHLQMDTQAQPGPAQGGDNSPSSHHPKNQHADHSQPHPQPPPQHRNIQPQNLMNRVNQPADTYHRDVQDSKIAADVPIGMGGGY